MHLVFGSCHCSRHSILTTSAPMLTTHSRRGCQHGVCAGSVRSILTPPFVPKARAVFIIFTPCPKVVQPMFQERRQLLLLLVVVAAEGEQQICRRVHTRSRGGGVMCWNMSSAEVCGF